MKTGVCGLCLLHSSRGSPHCSGVFFSEDHWFQVIQQSNSKKCNILTDSNTEILSRIELTTQIEAHNPKAPYLWQSTKIYPEIWWFFFNLIQIRIICEEGILIKKRHPSDWLVGNSVGIFSWLIINGEWPSPL